MGETLRPARRQALIEVVERYPEVQAVYLFGSIAVGKEHPRSDLDLAVYLCEEVEARSTLKLDLLADLTSAGFDAVDLIFFSEADLVLQYEAVSPNQLLYSTADFDHGSVYSRIVRKYLDFQPYLARQREAYRKRLLNG